MTVINTAIADFNAGNQTGWVGACDTPASIIDDFSPYYWQGAHACADWWKDFEAFAKKSGATENVVKLNGVRHMEAGKNFAYVVLNATYTYKQKGKPMSEPGAQLILAMTRTPGGWRMAGWTWSAPK